MMRCSWCDSTILFWTESKRLHVQYGLLTLFTALVLCCAVGGVEQKKRPRHDVSVPASVVGVDPSFDRGFVAMVMILLAMMNADPCYYCAGRTLTLTLTLIDSKNLGSDDDDE